MGNTKSTISEKNNTCANFVQGATLSNESRDYLVCLGMLEDLDKKMFDILTRDYADANEPMPNQNEWSEALEKVRSLIMDNFKEKLLANMNADVLKSL